MDMLKAIRGSGDKKFIYRGDANELRIDIHQVEHLLEEATFGPWIVSVQTFDDVNATLHFAT
jgi:hypothetical protein